MKRISLFFLAVMAILPMMADNNPRIVESLNLTGVSMPVMWMVRKLLILMTVDGKR